MKHVRRSLRAYKERVAAAVGWIEGQQERVVFGTLVGDGRREDLALAADAVAIADAVNIGAAVALPRKGSLPQKRNACP